MYGVSKITNAESVMLISFQAVQPGFMADTLDALGKAGVVVDMISQTSPSGSGISFSFTASSLYLDLTVQTIGGSKNGPAPMISGGYSKINLYGEEMVESVGVAARALNALASEAVEIAMITTSDLDISLPVRSEDEDVAIKALKTAFEVA